MRAKRAACALALVAVMLLGTPARALQGLSRDGVRAAYAALTQPPQTPLFDITPSSAPPYEPGALEGYVARDALEYAAFLRALAGLDGPLMLSDALGALAQRGALICAATGAPSHDPPRPDGYPDALYASGRMGAAHSNLATMNWMSGDILREALNLFALDDDADNAGVLGHRRWLLSPSMGATGFGLAADASGRSYVAMYALDSSAPREYDFIAWPPDGAFPAELMTRAMPWSISPNPALYDLAGSAPSITVEDAAGRRHRFPEPFGTPEDDAFFLIEPSARGGGPAYIFRPAVSHNYHQNQCFSIEVDGMLWQDGTPAPPICYVVELCALTPIDPAGVELSDYAADLAVGDAMRIDARVVPDWADDLSVAWSTDNPDVASVAPDGTLSALAPGTATVTARAVNGRYAEVLVTVGG